MGVAMGARGRRARVVAIGAAVALGAVGLVGMSPASSSFQTDPVSSPSDGSSARPAISSDGRFVAFQSDATNLVADDTNGINDIFVRDRVTGSVERVSVSSTGTEGTGTGSSGATISADGRFVAFDSGAAGLVPAVTSAVPHVYRHDRQTGETVLVDNVGDPSAQVFYSAMSADGAFVAYMAESASLPGPEVYRTEVATGATVLVSANLNGDPSVALDPNVVCCNLRPAISGDGRFVAFVSSGADLVPNDTNNEWDIFVRDVANGTTERVSVGSGGEQADGRSVFPSISDDGRYVAFTSNSSTLAPNTFAFRSGLFVRDRVTGATTVESVQPDGAEADGGINDISPDGRYVAFVTPNAPEIVPGAGSQVVILRDRVAGTNDAVAANADGYVAVDADGSAVAYDLSSNVFVAHTTSGGGVNTPFGTGVVVTPVDGGGGTPATLTFDDVTSAGSTTLTSSSTGPTAPSGFQTGSPATYYDISTTAGFTGNVSVCVSYDPAAYADPNAVSLWHYDTGASAWTDITSSVDTANDVVCGTTASFSPFTVLEPAPPADDGDGVPAAVEDAGPNGGDANHDGILDSQQAEVASLPNAADGRYVTLWSSSPGTSLTDVSASPLPAGVPLPPHSVLPVGLLNFEVHGVPTGGTANVQVLLPSPLGLNPNFALKLRNGAYVDARSLVTFVSSNSVQLTLRDGGPFDTDPADGVIGDPIAVGTSLNQAPIVNGNQTLFVAANGSKTVFTSAFDPNADPITYNVGTPSHGTLTGTAPNLTYTPAPGYVGDDSFTYTATDGFATSNVATVTIHVVVPPTITCTPVARSMPANGTYSISLAFTAVAAACHASDGSVVSVGSLTGQPVFGAPSHGTLSGTLTSIYHPAIGFVGQDSITIPVRTTSSLGQGTATLLINVVGVTLSPVQGDPGSAFSVSFYCQGLATVAIVKPGPVVVLSSAQQANGNVTFPFTVPSLPGGTLLTVTAVCNNTYGGYNAYSGYGGSNIATLPVQFFTVTAPPDDGDGVSEPPGYDGNGDGLPDGSQPNVTSLDAPGGAGVVTIAAPTDQYSLTNVAISTVTNPPAGVSFPIGTVSFSVHLPAGGHTADVVLYLPAGVNPTAFLKYVNGVSYDFTDNVTVNGDQVTLHLVDGEFPGDADSAANGVIVDPITPVVGYTFGGFQSPIDTGVPNNAVAGQTVPVIWRVTTAAGAPVTDPSSFVKITSKGGACGSAAGDDIEVYAPGSSGLQYLGDGVWQFNWKTDKAWKGQCRVLTLHLADGVETTRTASFKFK
jgi:Tol biopolymer transport system component